MSSITMNEKISQSNPRAWRNPWVIGWIALVTVVLIVNIVMISIAFITSPGLVSENYYERGQHYEKTLASKKAARDALGWNTSTDFPSTPVVNKNEVYRFNLVDSNSIPVSQAQVTATLYRPSDSKSDFSIVMNEVVTGVYAAEIRFPLKGQWELIVSVKRSADEYNFSRRVSVTAE